MLIKVLLVGGSVIFLFYFLVAARHRPAYKLAISAIFASIAFFALYPKLSDRVAAVVGVERGADLGLYLATLTLLALCFNLYLGQQRQEDRTVAVVRRLAILTARPAPPAGEGDEAGGPARAGDRAGRG